MKTVIGFDSWTGGAGKFERLVPFFKARGMNLVLLHLGSWGGDPGRPKEESIGELPARDISYYGGAGFREILEKEKPVAVVFLSVDVFAHRAFNRYCRQMGIPTLHLYHGLVRVQAIEQRELYKVNVINQLRFVLARVPKALAKVWPTYARSLYSTDAARPEWIRFASDVWNLACGKYIPRAADDARTTRCGVYTKADISHAVGKYGFSESEVSAVGNPDLAAFGLSESDIGAGIVQCNSNEVVYIDTGLIYAGMVFSGAEDFLNHLVYTKTVLERQGKHLSIKLHPQHFRTDFPEKIAKAGIEVIRNDAFVERLKNCVAAICEPSTAALIPCVVGAPVFLAQYGKLAQQAYGEVLITYPRARLLRDVSDVNELLRDERMALNPDQVMEWVSVNSGPLPAEKMPERVAEIVTGMIAK